MTEAALQIKGLCKYYGGGRSFPRSKRLVVRALDCVDLTVASGETLGIVGESGSGKSTFARTVLGLDKETSGSIKLVGQEVSGMERRQARHARRDIQYVHQDPGAALDPWWRVGDTLVETLRIGGISSAAERNRIISQMLEAVGLDDTFKSRYPHELSGGQQRRVGLARTLSLRPKIVILDEPTSGLDLSVQAGVLKLMKDIRDRFNLTYIFISHDLSVVERICDRIAIMYLGRIVETGTAREIFTDAVHPYTKALLASAPTLTRKPLVVSVEGDPPSAVNPPSGCSFHPRCSVAQSECAKSRPNLMPMRGAHAAACPPALRMITGMAQAG